MLESEFTEEEILKAVNECEGEKAPGPDGFNMNFFQKNWKAIKDDFMRFIGDFHESREFKRGLNVSFISLIPKVSNPKEITDFRPISLVGSLYKITGKVLANRLKKVMGNLISENQSTFMKGRQITDNLLIALEMIDSMKKNSEGGVVTPRSSINREK